MNKFTLRFPAQLEEIYQEVTKESALMHFKTYQPILILIHICVSIIQLQKGNFLNGVLEAAVTIFSIIQIPYVCKNKSNKAICRIFMTNNLMITGLQLLIDNSTPNYENQYVSGCAITIINMTLLEHYDFLWNAFAFSLVLSIRLVYIFYFFQFDGMVLIYILCSIYQYVFFYRKSYLKRILFLQYENEKEIRKVLDKVITDIFVHFKFDANSFQFKLKFANQTAEQKVGIHNNEDFKEFLHFFSVIENIQYNQDHQKLTKGLEDSGNHFSGFQTLGSFLYEKMIISKGKDIDIELFVLQNSSQQVYKVKCYSYTVVNQELIILMEQVHEENLQLKQKKQEILLLLGYLNKINIRIKKQLSQLCQILEQSEPKYYYQISDSGLKAQIISNVQIQMMLDAFVVQYYKIEQKMECFSIKNLISDCLIIMDVIANVELKRIYYDAEQFEDSLIIQIEFLVKFIIQSLLYLFIIQKDHKNIKITFNKLLPEQIICIKFHIDGLQSLEFQKQNTFIMQMIYKGLQCVGPRAEIQTVSDYNEDSFSMTFIQLDPQLFQIQIYSNLEDIRQKNF